MALLTRQLKISELFLGPLTFKLAPFIKYGTLGQDLCTSLRSLRIPQTIGSLSDLDVYDYLIEQAPLQKLAVCTDSIYAESEDTDTDHMSSSEKISSAVLGYLKSRSPAKKLQLNELYLEDFNVGISKFTLPRYIDFSTLPNLILSQCPNASKFVSILTPQFKKYGCRLKQFEFILHDDDSRSPKVIERFLLSFSGLRELSLVGYDGDDDGYHGLTSNAFKMHGNTLEVLTLHPEGSGNWESDELGIDRQFYTDITRDCRKLRQIAIPMPSICLPTPTQEQMTEYEDVFDLLLGLSDLKILRILNWPSFGPHFFSKLIDNSDEGIIARLNDAAWRQAMDHFVRMTLVFVFNKGYQGRSLPVMCFDNIGTNTVTDGDYTTTFDTPACYVPLRQKDVFGREQIALQNVLREEIKYFEPECTLVAWP